MKGFFRFLFLVVLLGVIVGGLGYIGWATLKGSHAGHNMNQSMNMQETPKSIPNKIAIQNKDQLTEAMDTLNKAMELITLDPYSQITVPSENNQMASKGTINIFPKDNSTINIDPSNNVNNQGSSMGNGQGNSDLNFVADQSKLEQIHTGIYRISQGMMLMSELSDDLANQATVTESNPPTVDTYVVRYNIAFQNKTKLTTALQMLNEAITLVNVNPYASSNGYTYNADKMEALHKGIYQLAQAITKLNKLNSTFSKQMFDAESQVTGSGMGNMNQGNMSNMGNMGPGSMGSMNMGGASWLPSLVSIIHIILIILVIGLIVGVFGTLVSLLNGKKQFNMDSDSQDEAGENGKKGGVI